MLWVGGDMGGTSRHCGKECRAQGEGVQAGDGEVGAARGDVEDGGGLGVPAQAEIQARDFVACP